MTEGTAMTEAPIWEQQTKSTSTAIREINPDGVKIEVNYHGEVTGKLKAMTMGTTTIWMKSDGTSTWEDKLIGNTPEGDMFVGTAKGTGKMAAGGRQDWTGETQLMSASPKLSWLNGKYHASGVADPQKGGSSGKFYAMK
jgi:hypothetical protein